MKRSGWVGVDLDGTLAKYGSWNGADSIGDPIPAMVARVQKLLAAGYEVRIVTARAHDVQSHKIIREWCKHHIGIVLHVTASKDFGMLAIYDDRAISVEPNTGKLLSPDFLLTEPA